MKLLFNLIGYRAFSVSEILDEIQSQEMRNLKYDFTSKFGALISELLRRNILLTEASHIINVASSNCTITTLKKLKSLGLTIDVEFEGYLDGVKTIYTDYFNAVEASVRGRNYKVFEYLAQTEDLSKHRNKKSVAQKGQKCGKPTYWFEGVMEIHKMQWEEAEKFFNILISNGYYPAQNEECDPISRAAWLGSSVLWKDPPFHQKCIKFFYDQGVDPLHRYADNFGAFEQISITEIIQFKHVQSETEYLRSTAELILLLKKVGAKPNKSGRRIIYNEFCSSLKTSLCWADRELDLIDSHHKSQRNQTKSREHGYCEDAHKKVLIAYGPIYSAIKVIGFNCKDRPLYQEDIMAFKYQMPKSAYDQYKETGRKHKTNLDQRAL